MKKRCLAMALALVMMCAVALPAAALEPVIVEAIPCQYDDAEDFSEGLAAVKQNGKWGYVDKTGKEVIAYKYDNARSFSEGLAAVYLDEKWGYIDKTGKEVVAYKYDNAQSFSEGLAAVGQTGKGAGFIDKTGKEIVPCKYTEVRPFSEGLAAVREGTGYGIKWGFVDKTGEVVIPVGKYSYPYYALSFHEGLTAVNNDAYGPARDPNARNGFINTAGELVIPYQYYEVPEVKGFQNGFVAVGNENGKWGVADRTGKLTVPYQYNRIQSLWSGRLVVNNENMDYALIDTTGKQLVPFGKYDCIIDSYDDLIRVYNCSSNDTYYGYIDAAGREVIPCVPRKYYRMMDFSEGFAIVQNKESFRWGFIDKTCKEVVPCKYSWVSEFSEGYAAVQLGDKWGYIAVSTPQTAYPSTQTVEVDGEKVTFQCYALKEGNGMTNYIKLRDVADVLNGSPAQFEVGYYGAVNIATGWAYTPNGSEGSTPFSGQRECLPTTQKVNIDGALTNLAAFTLTDDAGGGYTYYKLRDLGEAIGFKVDWTAERGIFIETK